jgi:hypothetical protein
MNRNWAWVGPTLLVLTVATVACEARPLKSREQLWQEAHPTQTGQDGQCIEFDGEDCDSDPFDLDDLYESAKPSKRPSSRPMQTANQPKPSPKTAVKPSPRRTR